MFRDLLCSSLGAVCNRVCNRLRNSDVPHRFLGPRLCILRTPHDTTTIPSSEVTLPHRGKGCVYYPLPQQRTGNALFFVRACARTREGRGGQCT